MTELELFDKLNPKRNLPQATRDIISRVYETMQETTVPTYKFVGSESELKWFFENVIEKPELNESYLMCIASRSKKVDKEARKQIQLGRSETMREQIITSRGKERLWNFDWFKSFFYRYECPYEGMITKSGDPYPQESLVLYFYVNPSDEHKVAMDNMTFTNGILNDLINACTNMSKDGIKEQLFKLRALDVHKKTCRATNISRHLWTQFDFDFSDAVKADSKKIEVVKDILQTCGNILFKKGNVVIIRTSGGFHILVHKEGMKYWGNNVRKKETFVGPKLSDPITQYIEYVKYKFLVVDKHSSLPEGSFKWYDEWVKTNQSFLPCPGTLQYGNFIVQIVNKEDFKK